MLALFDCKHNFCCFVTHFSTFLNQADIFKVFKLIDTFSGVTNRRDLLHKLIRILEKDGIFQDRLKQKFAQLGGIFLKLSEILYPHLSQIKRSASLNPLRNLPFSLFEPLFRQRQCVVRIRKYIIIN